MYEGTTEILYKILRKKFGQNMFPVLQYIRKCDKMIRLDVRSGGRLLPSILLRIGNFR